MKLYKMAALAIVIGLCAAALVAPDAFAAVSPAAQSSSVVHDLLLASPALLAMRAEHGQLVTQAAAKLAEATDGTPAADARRIETEHAELLRQADAVQTRIAAEEARIAAEPPVPPAPPASADLAAERTRAAEIVSIGTRAGLEQTAIDTAVRDGSTVEAFRTRAFDVLAANADRTMHSNVHVTRDEQSTRAAHMTDALTFRIGGAAALRDANGAVRPLSDGARGYANHSLAELAAEAIGHRAFLRTARDREEVLVRAFASHTTTDFPIIFGAAINSVLAARYVMAQPTYRRIAAKRNFRDFRPHNIIRVGDFPQLQAVGESGEIKFGSFGESKETVAVSAYAVQFGISRVMLVNDNLGAIDQMIGAYGDEVARFEETTFYVMKAVGSGAGPLLVTDSKRVFHTDHGNLAGTGTVIDVANLGAGRAAMRKQTNLSGNKINVSARTILVGPDKETEAEMAVASITPTKASDFNPFSGKLEVVAAPITGNAWELYADPGQLPVFVWGMLDGYTAPRLRIEDPFGTQGVKISLEHDFGAGAIDYRGAYRNPGA